MSGVLKIFDLFDNFGKPYSPYRVLEFLALGFEFGIVKILALCALVLRGEICAFESIYLILCSKLLKVFALVFTWLRIRRVFRYFNLKIFFA